MDMTGEQNVKWEMSGCIGILSIDLPPENRITKPEFISIDKLSEWLAEPGLRGVIITGAGRHFSSGADITALRKMAKDPEQMLSQLQKGNDLLNYIQNIPLPVIAAISGACFGAGLEVALACHIRICTENSLFAFPESALGIIPGLGGSARLLKLTSVEASMQLLFSGDVIDSQHAERVGIVDRIVPNKTVKEFAIDYLNKLVTNRPIYLIHSIMKSINNARTLPMDEALKKESAMFCKLMAKAFQ